ncbi:MAG: Gfo/Idh/MocA family protein [Bacillota bacterium]
MIGLGLIGCGNWGFNYLKTLSSIPETRIFKACDVNHEALQKVNQLFPQVITTTDYRDLLGDNQLSAVIIATPPHTHFPIAADFLEHNKAVLVEKPVTLSYCQAIRLIALAQKKNTLLMAGHLMEYHPVVVKLQEYICQGALGKLRYLLLDRTSLARVRSDVLWDLAVHDVSIVRYLINKNPIWLAAQGKGFLQEGIHDLITITMEFPDDLYVQIDANSLYPKKKRQTVVAGDKMVAILDDTLDDFKLTLIPYDGDITLPNLEKTPPLTAQCKQFLHCIQSDAVPRTGSHDIAWVMKVIHLIEQSLLNNGLRRYFAGHGGDHHED